MWQLGVAVESPDQASDLDRHRETCQGLIDRADRLMASTGWRPEAPDLLEKILASYAASQLLPHLITS